MFNLRKNYNNFLLKQMLGLVQEDIRCYGHSVAVFYSKDGKEETKQIILNVKGDRVEGLYWSELDTPTLGLRSLSLLGSTRLYSTDRTVPELRYKIETISKTIMYDEKVTVLRTKDGREFIISRGQNVNNDGIVVNESEIGYATFLRWAILGLYDFEWFPYGEEPVAKEDFVYYTWMGDKVRDKSYLAPPSNDGSSREADKYIVKLNDDFPIVFPIEVNHGPQIPYSYLTEIEALIQKQLSGLEDRIVSRVLEELKGSPLGNSHDPVSG